MSKIRMKTSLLALLGLASTGVFAHSGAFKGFYAGLEVGAMQTNAHINSTTYTNFLENVGDNPAYIFSSQEGREYKHSVAGAFNLGYGDFIGDVFHLAGEVFVNVAQRRAALSDNSSGNVDQALTTAISNDTRAKLNNWEAGVDLLPGVLLMEKSLAYARVGAAFNRLDVDSSSVFTFTDLANPQTYQSGLFTSRDKSRVGLRLGLGLEQAVCPNLSVTADYIYTYYGKVSTTGAADVTTVSSAAAPVNNANGLNNSSSARLATQSLMVGAKYYFH